MVRNIDVYSLNTNLLMIHYNYYKIQVTQSFNTQDTIEYDVETQFYWVSSRYYSPKLCRWISPDSIEYLDPESINGLNLYAYYGNDPINYIDLSGHIVIPIIIFLVGLVGAYIGVSVERANNTSNSFGISGWEKFLYSVSGIFMDVVLSMLYLGKVSSIANPFISAIVGGTIDAVVDIIQTPLFFTPEAQERIKGISSRNTSSNSMYVNKWIYTYQ